MPLSPISLPHAGRHASRAGVSILCLLIAACAPESYEREADTDVYDIIDELDEDYFAEHSADTFRIDRPDLTLRDRLFGDLEDGAIESSLATQSIVMPERVAESDSENIEPDGSLKQEDATDGPGDGSGDPDGEERDLMPSDLQGEEHDGGGGVRASLNPSTLLGESDDEPAVLAVQGPENALASPPQATSVTDQVLTPAGVVELDLQRMLAVAFENSREFQTRKENVYVVALNLTRQQFNFGLQWFDQGSAGVDGVEGDTGDASIFNTLGVNQAFAFGGSLGASILSSFSRIIVEDGEWSLGSALSASFTTPLMQGFGYWIAREPLTQAERDALYAVREFKRFERTFTVSIASQFLRALLQKANLRNAEENLISLRDNADRQREFHQAGRIDIVQLGQAAQDELNAEQRVVSASAALDGTLDQLKLTLGLPVTARLELLDRDFEKLEESMASEFHPDEARCIEMARTLRQDLIVSRGRLVDADRQVNIAANALQMGLDLSLSTSVPTDDRQPFDFQFDQVRYAGGLAWDLPIQRLPERNTYRRSLITRDQVRRSWEQTRDQVDLEVRRSLRNLELAKLSYDIQRSALELATTRVDSSRLRQEAGRATVRDFLESQRDLLSAQDATYTALIGYVIAQLELVRDLGILEVNVGESTFDARLDRLISP